MSSLIRIVLDVLKPHQPNALEFAKRIGDLNCDSNVKLTVVEMDEKTESIVLEIKGKEIDFGEIVDTISNMGGSVHSIDEVEVTGKESDKVDGK